MNSGKNKEDIKMDITTEISNFIDDISKKTKVPNFIANDFVDFDPNKTILEPSKFYALFCRNVFSCYFK